MLFRSKVANAPDAWLKRRAMRSDRAGLPPSTCWVTANRSESHPQDKVLCGIEPQKRNGCAANRRLRLNPRAFQTEMIAPTVEARVEEPDDFTGFRVN